MQIKRAAYIDGKKFIGGTPEILGENDESGVTIDQFTNQNEDGE